MSDTQKRAGIAQYRELAVIGAPAKYTGTAAYDRSQFETLFQTIREVVADEMMVAAQPIFVPIRRLTSVFKNARVLAASMNAAGQTGVTAIGILEQALHAVDVLHKPRGAATHTAVAEQSEMGSYVP